MAGIEAHADAAGAVQVTDDRRKMLEAMAKRATLTRRVLENDQRLAAGSGLEGFPDRVRDQTKRVVFRSGRAGPRMDDDAKEAECVGAIEFVDKRGDRLLPKHW